GRTTEKGDIPVVGARISAQARRGNMSESVFAESDGEGRFTLRGLADRLYPVVAAAPGFSPLEMSLSPSSDEQALVMTRPVKVSGRVLDPDGLGVNRAQVSAQRGDDRRKARSASTTSDGRFTLELADLGALTLAVNAEGFVAFTKMVQVDTDADLGDLVLSRGIHIRGFVTDSRGTGISGARVENQTLRMSRTTFVETDDKGAFDLPGGSAGQVRLAAGHRDYSPAQVTVDIPERTVGSPEPIQITLTKGGRIEGFVRYRDGSPVSQAPVQIRSLESNTPRASDVGSGPGSDTAFTNSTGGFTFEKLAPGPARLMLMAGQNVSVTTTDVAIEEGVTSSATLTLRPTVVRGVVRRNGGAAAGLKVSVFAPQSTSLFGSEPVRGLSEGTPWTTALTDSAGRFELRVVSPLKGIVVVDGGERGLTLFSKSVDIPDVDEFPLDLEFGGAKLSGRVLDEETGQGLRDAYVSGRAIPKQGELNAGVPSSALTDATGAFTLDAAPGEYQLSISAAGYLSTRARAVVSPPESEVADISLAKGGTLTARVLLPSGAPAVEAQVGVSDSAVSVNAFTGPDGRFTLRGLPKDGFTLTITHGSDIALTQLPGIPSEPMDIRLVPGARIKVTLVGAVEVAPGAIVFVRQLNNAAYFGRLLGFVDARGQATLVTPPGEVLLGTSATNFSGEALVQARGGETVSVEIELKPRTAKPSNKELH
ncbi:MAG: carboxypeptidase-like regulatory domain-containing protein, partial [Vicinamibacteria bacterium]